MVEKRNILERWEITAEELTEVVDANPSLRGFLMGYVSESKIRKFFSRQESIKNIKKYDDHDRGKKGDLAFEYKGKEIRSEVKSLQTNSVKRKGEIWVGTFQCDASDRRMVTLPNGHRVETTCLVVNEFDLLAVNLFAFGEEWRYAYARNKDLPRTESKKYSIEDRKYLLKSLMPITWPLQPPYYEDPFAVLDKIVSG